MSEAIKIKFRSTITQNHEQQVIEYFAFGKRYLKGKQVYIQFTEPVMENNASNQITWILASDHLTILRKGQTNMRQTHYLNQVGFCFYYTPYGQMEMHTLTEAYEYDGNALQLRYQLVFNEEIMGEYQLFLEIKGAEENECGD